MKKQPTFSTVGPLVKAMGYEPLPVVPGTKKCLIKKWESLCINDAQVEQWTGSLPQHNTAIRLSEGLICLDIDLLKVDAVTAVQKVINAFIDQQLDDAGSDECV